MSLQVHLAIDAGPLRKFATDFPAKLRTAMRGALKASGRDLVGKAKEFAPADSGGLRRGMDSTIIETPEQIAAVIFNRLRYSIFVHGGAKFPGKMPPPRALLQWARRHLTNKRLANSRAYAAAAGVVRVRRQRTTEEEALSLAWAVAKAIKRRGFLPPRPFLRDAFRARRANIESLIRQAFQDVLAKSAE